MLARLPKRPFSLDPLIAEAKRRMRRRRLLVTAVIVVLAGGAGAVFGLHNGGSHPAGPVVGAGSLPPLPTPRPPDRVVTNVFGQPSSSAERAGRPLDKTLALFRSSRVAAALPTPVGSLQSLAAVATHMHGDPGALLVHETRRVVTGVGPVYVVPTTHGWVRLQGPRFETCDRGLLGQVVNWHFESAGGGMDVVGIAADGVSGVAWAHGKTERRASLHDNVFSFHLPLPSFPRGTVTISYRDGRPNARVLLR